MTTATRSFSLCLGCLASAWLAEVEEEVEVSMVEGESATKRGGGVPGACVAALSDDVAATAAMVSALNNC